MMANEIASIVGWIVIVTALWYGLGLFVNSYVIYPIVHRVRPGKRSNKATPDWVDRLYYVVAGPVGWAAWIYDHLA